MPNITEPIPIPTSEDDLGECIRFLRQNGYEDSEERVTMCLSTFRQAQGTAQTKAIGNKRGG
jgi:hypothetical protein